MELLIQAVLIFLIGAVVVESITKIIHEKWDKIDPTLLSIVVGILISFYAKLNILTVVGIEYGWNGNAAMETVGMLIGIILSGLILSRGSNGVHDFFSKIKSAKEVAQAQAIKEETEAEFSLMGTDFDSDLRG